MTENIRTMGRKLDTGESALDQVFQLAIAQHHAGRLQEAGELYLNVLQAQPNHADANYNMGVLALQMNQPVAGLFYFEAALDIDPTCGQYWLSYIDAFIQAGQLDEARQILALARQQGFQGDDVNALVARLEGNASATAPPQKTVTKPNTTHGNASGKAVSPPEKSPTPQEVNHLVAMFNQGRYAEAESVAQAMTERFPSHGIGWLVLGTVLKQTGRSVDALAPMQTAAALSPDDSNAHSNLGAVYRDLGRLSEAEASLRRALKINPNYTQAHINLGATLQDMGRLDEAIAHLQRALQLKPDCAEAHYNLGNLTKDLGRLSEAEASYRHALQIKPDYAEACCNLGNVLNDMKRPKEAEECFHRALAAAPNYADAHNNLGITIKELGRLDEAEHSCRRALQLNPDFALAHCNLGLILHDSNRYDEAVVSYRRAIEIKPDFALANDNLLYILSLHAGEPGQQNEEIMLAARQYDEQFCLPHRAVWQQHRNSRDPNRRLRIGYVSPDFRRHAVAYFAEPIFARHDKSQVEIFCYAEVTAEDDYTARFQKLADHWHSTIGLSDDQVAVMIREHQIDILVDLAGHTSKNRLLVFARKPAPLQMTYLGYPGTSGLSTMDYRLTDRHADPEGMTESHYVERLLRLPDSLYCYRPSVDMPEPSVLPTLARGYLTFGSFNNANKIDQRTLTLWAELLRTVPTARLMMLTMPEGELRRRWIRRFEALGIDAQRLEFHGKLPTAEFHRKFLEVDISLDTVSVSGGTTTCESLWMGVPVIACVGQRFITRVTHSCLSTVGLDEFSAASPEDYVRIAARFADDIPRLAHIRAGLRDRLRASPLVDELRFARNLESIYRDIWKQWCGTEVILNAVGQP